jgi:predicted NACHT family NTPase
MKKDNILQLTKDYLDAIANAPDFIYVDAEAQIPLTQVHLMLETIKEQPPAPMEKRDELVSSEERLESAGIKDLSDTRKEQSENRSNKNRPPIPISKALQENQHLVLLGEPGAGKTTTLQYIGLCFAKQDENWASDRLEMDETRIPVRLLLQEYANDFAQQRLSIADALVIVVQDRLSCTKEVAHKLVEE